MRAVAAGVSPASFARNLGSRQKFSVSAGGISHIISISHLPRRVSSPVDGCVTFRYDGSASSVSRFTAGACRGPGLTRILHLNRSQRGPTWSWCLSLPLHEGERTHWFRRTDAPTLGMCLCCQVGASASLHCIHPVSPAPNAPIILADRTLQCPGAALQPGTTVAARSRFAMHPCRAHRSNGSLVSR